MSLEPGDSRDPNQVAQDLIDDIMLAFEDVTREGGVSWNEAEVLDRCGSEEEQLMARALDRESHWTELIKDLSWDTHGGIGGFPFLDSIGARYYLPVLMIRRLKRIDHSDSMAFFLERPPEKEFLSLLTKDQLRCIANYVDFDAGHVFDDEVGQWKTPDLLGRHLTVHPFQNLWRKYLSL